jgi:allantoin racemase
VDAKTLLLINPNSSAKTTQMMVGIAAAFAGDDMSMVGATATRSPLMITTQAALLASADEVIEIGVREAKGISGIIVGAYGDPGLERLRDLVSIPVVGICEASMIEAASGGRRFGVATVTPELADAIEERARELNLHDLYCGIRLTSGDPVELANDPARLERELIAAVRDCLEKDRAEAVIIGGGPLGQAASALAPMFKQPVIAPIPAAVRLLLGLIDTR